MLKNLLKRFDEFAKKHKRWAKTIKIAVPIFAIIGILINIFIANGIVYINHYIKNEDYKISITDTAPQYFSPTQRNFTVIVNNGWLNDLPTRVEGYSIPNNNEITFNVICDDVPCDKVEKQSFKKFTVVMTISGNVEQKISICSKASEIGNEANNMEKCSESYIMSFSNISTR